MELLMGHAVRASELVCYIQNIRSIHTDFVVPAPAREVEESRTEYRAEACSTASRLGLEADNIVGTRAIQGLASGVPAPKACGTLYLKTFGWESAIRKSRVNSEEDKCMGEADYEKGEEIITMRRNKHAMVCELANRGPSTVDRI